MYHSVFACSLTTCSLTSGTALLFSLGQGKAQQPTGQRHLFAVNGDPGRFDKKLGSAVDTDLVATMIKFLKPSCGTAAMNSQSFCLTLRRQLHQSDSYLKGDAHDPIDLKRLKVAWPLGDHSFCSRFLTNGLFMFLGCFWAPKTHPNAQPKKENAPKYQTFDNKAVRTSVSRACLTCSFLERQEGMIQKC